MMSRDNGLEITEIEHIKQSIQDILLTPIGSRVMRREYGSLLFQLIDSPTNDTTEIQLFGSWRHTPFRKSINVISFHLARSWRHTPFRNGPL